jgi:hypothetical protein
MNSLTPLDKHSDGEPKVIGTGEPALKTNYRDPKKRYELAERMVWSKLPGWKKATIIECKVKGIENDRIFNEYAHEIAMMAECESIVLDEKCPPVPHLSVENRPVETGNPS